MLRYLKNVVTLQLDSRLCNGCGMCVTVCPHAVFDIKDRKAVIVDRDVCIECGACAINCPVNAIRVQTGAGCAAGIILGAIGVNSCCSGACGTSPVVADSNQASCCNPGIDSERTNTGMPAILSTTNRQKEIDMTTSVVIYESAMCCSSGVCGPNPDKSLIDLQDALEKIQKMDAKIERYTITGNPKKFRDNQDVIKLIQQQQMKALPITTVNGKVVKVGSYPTLDEFLKYIKGNNADLPAAEVKAGNVACCADEGLNGENGCCAGQNSCDIRCSPNYIGVIKNSNKGKCC